MPDEQKRREAAEAVAAAKVSAEAAREKAKQAKAEAEKSDASEDAKKAADEAETAASQAEQALTQAEAEMLALGGPTADDLLGDGTDPNKKISVSFAKFQDINEKAKLFEQSAPVLAKLKDNPELLKKLMEGDDPTLSLKERLERLEQRFAEAKRGEVTTAINQALATWGVEFRSRWEEIKPLVAGLEAQGVSYAEALQRAYFAVNPEAASAEARIAGEAGARDLERRRGEHGRSGGGMPPARRQDDVAYDMTDADKAFASSVGIDPKLYAKHSDWVDRFKDL